MHSASVRELSVEGFIPSNSGRKRDICKRDGAVKQSRFSLSVVFFPKRTIGVRYELWHPPILAAAGLRINRFAHTRPEDVQLPLSNRPDSGIGFQQSKTWSSCHMVAT